LTDDQRQARKGFAGLNSISQIIPERETELAAGFFQAGEGVSTPPPQIFAQQKYNVFAP